MVRKMGFLGPWRAQGRGCGAKSQRYKIYKTAQNWPNCKEWAGWGKALSFDPHTSPKMRKIF